MDQSGQDRSMQNLENAAEGFPQRLMAQSPGCLGGGGGVGIAVFICEKEIK